MIDEAAKGEEFVITRYGKPVARLVGQGTPTERELGCHPIAFASDLSASSDQDVIDLFDPVE